MVIKMKYFRYLSALLLLCLLLVSCHRSRNISNRNIVAKVGSAELTVDELRQRLPEMGEGRVSVDQMKGYILQWTNSQLTYQQALNEGLHNTYQADLNMALRQFETEYLANKLIEREVKRNIQVSEEELQKYYQEDTDRFKRVTTEIRVIHLLVSSPDTVALIRQKIKNGIALSEIVDDYSTQTPVWPNGDLGFFPLNTVPEPFKNTLSRMKVGTTTPRPVTSEFGSHFFQLMDKQGAGTVREIEQVKLQIEELLQAQKRHKAYQLFVAGLRTRAEENNELIINYAPLKEFAPDTTFRISK